MSDKVLPCDDEIHILRAAEFKLKREGFEVTLANDGEEAWEAMRCDLPHVVVTDCQMPRLDGVSLVQRMRSDPRTADLPVITLTAKGYELDRRQLKQDWKVAAVLDKPFSPRQLAASVRQLLDTGRCQRPAPAMP